MDYDVINYIRKRFLKIFKIKEIKIKYDNSIDYEVTIYFKRGQLIQLCFYINLGIIEVILYNCDNEFVNDEIDDYLYIETINRINDIFENPNLKHYVNSWYLKKKKQQ